MTNLPQWLLWVCTALTVYRVAALVLEDELARPAREAITDKYVTKARPGPVWYYLYWLTSCYWCICVYISAAAVAGWVWLPAEYMTAGVAVGALSVAGPWLSSLNGWLEGLEPD